MVLQLPNVSDRIQFSTRNQTSGDYNEDPSDTHGERGHERRGTQVMLLQLKYDNHLQLSGKTGQSPVNSNQDALSTAILTEDRELIHIKQAFSWR